MGRGSDNERDGDNDDHVSSRMSTRTSKPTCRNGLHRSSVDHSDFGMGFGVMTKIGVGRLFSRIIDGWITAMALPTLTFIVCAFVSLTTGTSFGKHFKRQITRNPELD